MLKAGERAPEFTLPDQSGTDRSLTQLLSAGAIVLYFYPADFTPGCTRQACALRDLHTDIQKAGLNVVGISPQPPVGNRSAARQLPRRLQSSDSRRGACGCAHQPPHGIRAEGHYAARGQL